MWDITATECWSYKRHHRSVLRCEMRDASSMAINGLSNRDNLRYCMDVMTKWWITLWINKSSVTNPKIHLSANDHVNQIVRMIHLWGEAAEPQTCMNQATDQWGNTATHVAAQYIQCMLFIIKLRSDVMNVRYEYDDEENMWWCELEVNGRLPKVELQRRHARWWTTAVSLIMLCIISCSEF